VKKKVECVWYRCLINGQRLNNYRDDKAGPYLGAAKIGPSLDVLFNKLAMCLPISDPPLVLTVGLGFLFKKKETLGLL
jgi:hypothetical protein